MEPSSPRSSHKQHYNEMRNPTGNLSLLKSTLKQRCLTRMKDARGDALKKAREDGSLASRVRNLMEAELNTIHNLYDKDEPVTVGDDYINVMRMLEQEIMDELRTQEDVLLKEYEEVRKFEEEELNAALESYYGAGSEMVAPSTLIPCMYSMLLF